MKDSTSSGAHLFKAAGAMGIATFLSRIMGLVREQVFAILFGAGNFTDAFNVAFRIPNLLRDLFAEGAMSASLVPVFTRTRVEEGDRKAWRVAGLVFRVLLWMVSLIALFGCVFSPNLVSIYAGAFRLVPGKFELTVKMTRIMFAFFPLVALAAAFMGVLNSCGVFFLPAFASALFNVTSIIIGVVFAKFFEFHGQWGVFPIEGMAIGVVVGGAVQACCQLPALYRVGYRWRKKLPVDPIWIREPRLKQMLWMMLPGTLGLAATQVNLLVNTMLATSQTPGSVSWLNYAFRLMQFPIGIFGVSLASAALPKISRQWANRDIDAACHTLSHALKSVFAINLPASFGLAVLGYPIIELIFQYGRFGVLDTRATSMALIMYAVGLTAYSSVKVLVPACYAFGNTRLPVISSVLSVLLTIGLNLIMVKPLGYWGLALGTSLAALFNAGFLVFAIRRLVRGLGGEFALDSILKSLVGYFLAAFMMAIVCWGSYQLILDLKSDFFLQMGLGRLGVVLTRAFRVLFLVTEGVMVFMVSARLLKLKEANELMNLFAEKLKNKLRHNLT